MDVAILHHRADAEVAGAKFVEGGDALDKLAATVGYGLGDAFTQKYVQTKLGGHEIIAVRIAAWLRIPKLMAEDGVHIKPSRQRLHIPSTPDVVAPRYECFL